MSRAPRACPALGPGAPAANNAPSLCPCLGPPLLGGGGGGGGGGRFVWSCGPSQWENHLPISRLDASRTHGHPTYVLLQYYTEAIKPTRFLICYVTEYRDSQIGRLLGRAKSSFYPIVILTDMQVVSSLFGVLKNCLIKRYVISGDISEGNTRLYTLGRPFCRCFVSFWKFRLPIGLHNSCSISPSAGISCQKCFTKHHD